MVLTSDGEIIIGALGRDDVRPGALIGRRTCLGSRSSAGREHERQTRGPRGLGCGPVPLEQVTTGRAAAARATRPAGPELVRGPGAYELGSGDGHAGVVLRQGRNAREAGEP